MVELQNFILRHVQQHPAAKVTFGEIYDAIKKAGTFAPLVRADVTAAIGGLCLDHKLESHPSPPGRRGNGAARWSFSVKVGDTRPKVD